MDTQELYEAARSLNKGDMLSATQVCELMGVEHVDPASPPPALRLAGRLEHVYAQMGRNWSVRADSTGCLRVLTDEEALGFNARRHRAGRRKIKRAKAGLEGVDVHMLSKELRQEHDSLSRVVTAHYMATRYTRPDPSELAKESARQPEALGILRKRGVM